MRGYSNKRLAACRCVLECRNKELGKLECEMSWHDLPRRRALAKALHKRQQDACQAKPASYGQLDATQHGGRYIGGIRNAVECDVDWVRLMPGQTLTWSLEPGNTRTSSQIASGLVYGADFCRNRHCKTNPVDDLEGCGGQV